MGDIHAAEYHAKACISVGEREKDVWRRIETWESNGRTWCRSNLSLLSFSLPILFHYPFSHSFFVCMSFLLFSVCMWVVGSAYKQILSSSFFSWHTDRRKAERHVCPFFPHLTVCRQLNDALTSLFLFLLFSSVVFLVFFFFSLLSLCVCVDV